MQQSRVLVVEDDSALREALIDALGMAGYHGAGAGDGVEALAYLERHGADMVVSDVQMAPMDGYTLLRKVKGTFPDLPVILITAYGTVQKAVQAMRDGAADYLVKPFEAQTLTALVERHLPRVAAVEPGLVAEDPRTLELVELARRVAQTEATVMISGESGTGKEVFAQYIHRCSARAGGAFVAINCAAIPDNMLEAVLFGYEKGAFTGAYQSTPGKFEQANGGTLLLDEISEMDLGLQAKLLRVLQEREVERLGGRKVIPLDVRVLATSNRIMREEVAAGRFREDLYYRLHVFPLHLLPLRERPGDILPLARHFLACHSAGGPVPELAADARARLLTHSWPGNVRELDNMIQRALILKQGHELHAAQLCLEEPPPVTTAVPPPGGPPPELNDQLKAREEHLIIDALRAANGSRKSAAEKLGISQRTLRYKLARLRAAGVEIPRRAAV
ncbi:MAG TPA: sigma-54-dependent Fis family transcriptional regulator [Gammaproteobacteria bacterium]|nr:sigma-54-dependent Fis family transcriptional regulator [Gammaproteobacteria bacterium]